MTSTDHQDHHRRSIRLKGYDYALPGGYFITLVTWGRLCLFGELVRGEVELSVAGKIVWEEWFTTGEIRPNVELNEDEFTIMPNHVHGIIWITDKTDDVIGVGAQRRCAPTKTMTDAYVVPGSLGAIVRAFKSATTRRINALNGTPGAPGWQRNYYEHIIRNESELDEIRAYMRNNPQQWELDHENPTQFPNPG